MRRAFANAIDCLGRLSLSGAIALGVMLGLGWALSSLLLDLLRWLF